MDISQKDAFVPLNSSTFMYGKIYREHREINLHSINNEHFEIVCKIQIDINRLALVTH